MITVYYCLGDIKTNHGQQCSLSSPCGSWEHTLKESTKGCSVWWLCGRSCHHINSVDLNIANHFPYGKRAKAGLRAIKRK